MKTLKTGLLTLGLIIGATSFAQEKNVEKINKQTEKMAYDLSLTPEQKIKVSEINNGVEKKNEEVLNNTNLSPEQKKERLQNNNGAKRAQMKLVLTEEQYKKYCESENKEVHIEHMEQKKSSESPKKVVQY